MIVLGTRPEAIKLAPVIRMLRAEDEWRTAVVSTGQHRDMLTPLLPVLDLDVDVDLSVMRERHSLPSLTARVLTSLEPLLEEHRPDVVVVQGDTTTAMCAALASFYARVPVAHVEAGLRSGVADDPFPEELNRRIISQIASWHFAPTQAAAANLYAEGVPAISVDVTGNTIVDSLRWMLSQRRGRGRFRAPDRKVLVTLHRRENQGDTMRCLAQAVAGLARRGNVEVVLPVHHNPAVREVLVPELGQVDGVRLTGPLCYDDFIATLSASDLVLTDSGGVQEEAVALGKPVLVLRRTTERPEAVKLGAVELVGVDARAVYERAMDLLTGRGCPLANRPSDVFGRGDAAVRIVERLARDLTEKPRRALDVHEMQSKDHERSLPRPAGRLEEEAVG